MQDVYIYIGVVLFLRDTGADGRTMFAGQRGSICHAAAREGGSYFFTYIVTNETFS